jgi:hypothetical protein
VQLQPGGRSRWVVEGKRGSRKSGHGAPGSVLEDNVVEPLEQLGKTFLDGEPFRESLSTRKLGTSTLHGHKPQHCHSGTKSASLVPTQYGSLTPTTRYHIHSPSH